MLWYRKHSVGWSTTSTLKNFGQDEETEVGISSIICKLVLFMKVCWKITKMEIKYFKNYAKTEKTKIK